MLVIGCVDLGLLGGTLVQYKVRCCMWLSRAICLELQVIPVCGCLCSAWMHVKNSKPFIKTFTSTEPGASPQMSQDTQDLPVCWLPFSLSHWKSIWLYFSAGHETHRMGQEGVQSSGYFFPPGWCHLQDSALHTHKKRWYLPYGNNDSVQGSWCLSLQFPPLSHQYQ